jgi:hypothetical protein
MFSLPQIVVTPILASLGSGSATWPTVGAVMAWALFAALVGSALGILREYTRTTHALDRSDGTNEVMISHPPVAFDHGHREAA